VAERFLICYRQCVHMLDKGGRTCLGNGWQDCWIGVGSCIEGNLLQDMEDIAVRYSKYGGKCYLA